MAKLKTYKVVFDDMSLDEMVDLRNAIEMAVNHYEELANEATDKEEQASLMRRAIAMDSLLSRVKEQW